MTLAIESLSVRFGAIDALRDVSCAAAAGKLTVIVGPNAAGKSTLLRACTGAVRPSAGGVMLDGRPMHEWPVRRLAARMAYVPQQSLVSAAFTVREIVELGRYALPADRAKVEHAMEVMEVADLAGRLFAHLSQGQQQRVTVARALAQVGHEGILVLDEPMSAMDLAHMLATMRLLRRLASEGATILLAIHDLDAARHFADNAWLLAGGRLAAAGPASEVLTAERLSEVFSASFALAQGTEPTPHLVPVFDSTHSS